MPPKSLDPENLDPAWLSDWTVGVDLARRDVFDMDNEATRPYAGSELGLAAVRRNVTRLPDVCCETTAVSASGCTVETRLLDILG